MSPLKINFTQFNYILNSYIYLLKIRIYYNKSNQKI